jgi:N12 class adenine-specific DNA methylase
MKTPVIYDTIDREERVVNQEATLAARDKQKLIKERFRAWIFSDADPTERLVRLYNDGTTTSVPVSSTAHTSISPA